MLEYIFVFRSTIKKYHEEIYKEHLMYFARYLNDFILELNHQPI